MIVREVDLLESVQLLHRHFTGVTDVDLIAGSVARHASYGL